MDKTIGIHGHLFRIITAPSEREKIINLPYKAYNIYEAYRTQPSFEKISTWEHWKRWADDLGFTIWVSSTNSFKYTIGFCGEYEDNRICGYITDLHQKVVIL